MAPLRDRMPLADLALHVRATYAGGATLEDVDAIAWSNAADQAMIVFFITTHAELARRSFHDTCPQCRLYVNFGRRQRYAVPSVYLDDAPLSGVRTTFDSLVACMKRSQGYRR